MTESNPNPRRRRRRMVADFPPEMLDAWELASRGELVLSFESKGAAMNFRQQLHSFRKAFVQENGQASVSHFWNYDLEIKDPTDETPSWQIVCSKIYWKEQIRDQMKNVATPAPQIKNPADIVPPGIEENKSSAEVLSELGFKS